MNMVFPFTPFIYAKDTVNRNSSTYTQDGMITGLENSIVRNSNEAFVIEFCSIEINRRQCP